MALEADGGWTAIIAFTSAGVPVPVHTKDITNELIPKPFTFHRWNGY
jgi:hypothetical protein